MDTWLSNLLRVAPKPTLNSVRTQADVIAAKPATAFDLCYLTGDTTFTTPVTDMALCDADPRLAKHASPRQVAGGSLPENILKCQLKPLDPADYAPAVLQRRPAGTAARRVPRRRVRLDQARRRSAGGDLAADLRRRSRRAAAAARARVVRALRSIVWVVRAQAGLWPLHRRTRRASVGFKGFATPWGTCGPDAA